MTAGLSDGPGGFGLRPDPVLVVGVAGSSGPGLDEGAGDLPGLLDQVFAALGAECTRIVAADPDLFSGAIPRLRVVTRLSDESEIAIVAAATRAGAEICTVPPHGAGALAPVAASRPTPFDVAGTPDDPRGLHRAGTIILDRSDILLVRWDGRPDAGRGSVAFLVQAAVERRIPVLLLPWGPTGEVEIIADPDDLLLPPVACDLPRVPLARNLDRVLARAFAPPVRPAERKALRTLLSEPAHPKSRRPEYPALLLLAARALPGPAAPSAEEEWRRAVAVAALVSAEAATCIARIEAVQRRMEDLAAFYGRRVRSGIVLRYAMPALGGLTVALLAILAPQIGLAWLGVQAVVMTLTIGEATYAGRRHWDDRWLDYRSLAERLRCDRFMLPHGFGQAGLEADSVPEEPAWTIWWHRRLMRGNWTGGRLTPETMQAAFDHLAAIEITGQIRYHDGADRRFRSLARRLRLLGAGSIVSVVLASLVLLGLSRVPDGFPIVQALVMAALITLPSVFLATRGIRLEGAFDLSAARSKQAAATLRLLQDRMSAAPPSAERLEQASRAAAAAMIFDTADWRVAVQRSRTPYRA